MFLNEITVGKMTVDKKHQTKLHFDEKTIGKMTAYKMTNMRVNKIVIRLNESRKKVD